MAYYPAAWGFGRSFEGRLGADMGAFLRSFAPETDLLLAARDDDGALQGSVVLQGPRHNGDGSDDDAHLRWFIVADGQPGMGLGRALLRRATGFADAMGYPMCYLTTFPGLSAARHLYESAGFRLVATSTVDQWDGGVQEQRFERLRGGEP
ncbi:GNAT family N-acetyltransferase [Roseospira navarrensis]|uniref:GNAT family N-acetyltransferase n=2 Tax=Roseospira navarrensis TaxID=140058 RepID=A0A7X1ZCE5_9PROT|nr:GNAT family N-acetyltransferase [Roseospira navarrensis]